MAAFCRQGSGHSSRLSPIFRAMRIFCASCFGGVRAVERELVRPKPLQSACRWRRNLGIAPRVAARFGRRGLVAEWLRRGLQILAPRFDSGRGLHFRGGKPGGTNRDPMNRPTSPEIYGDRRWRMIENQLRPSGVNDLPLLAAFAETPHEAFVEPAFASLAYLDRDVPALQGAGRLLLAPASLGRLLQAAKPQPGERILDVAGGSGYGAAILSRLGARVTALETAASGQGANLLLAGRPGVDV